ncbi:M14 family metallopeptidase [Mangrovimonas sp. AS39]|uniref:M14 family metallopeptidase n=1 Tax=Mangrovimonas futianensis TaxID=2895523 RepID=UPI001E532BB7|nr:M14 family metallopeptidase [Mangrovimonas futianensis]MCF1191348.1 M14 family metallopeptidase [Mangrovimonas futianensis]MCF1195043.1 M14 family metallopeptidase [Mangrovimonas futianensis]
MKKRFFYIITGILCLSFKYGFCQENFVTQFEKSNGLETAAYYDVIAYYQNLAAAYPTITVDSMGITDSGERLHLVTFDPDKNFDFESNRKNKRILLINNGIHPGEPDGIDATMMLFRDYASGQLKAPKNTIIATIPIYNIGGSLNRNSGTRANQNGPKEYGFRGNSRNYDLNRDFIKCDTENAKSFAEIYHLVNPDVFIDNHVSNGADYQYVLTHLFTQHNKMGGPMGAFINETFRPQLEQELASKSWDITPYVNVFNAVPEKGFSQFMDYPRYSTGYTTLWGTLGMMLETHMLKPYKQRVEGTYLFMQTVVNLTETHGEKIRILKEQQTTQYKPNESYPLDYKIDTTRFSTLEFKGYEGEIITSEVTGLSRLKYHRDQPFSKQFNYQNYFVPSVEVDIPRAYVIPQGWHHVIELLKLNQIEMTQIQKDTTISVESYRIQSFETRNSPYEGHYLHYNTQILLSKVEKTFRAGDFIINTQQKGIRYLLETFEPQAPDSFFNWNFFDTILQQKEGFSPYVWEDKASEMLKQNPDLKREFENKKYTDGNFAKNWYAQLEWLFQKSDNYELAHMNYPIYRIN